MKLFTADDPKDSSAIQLFIGLLDSLGEPMIDSYLGSLLEKGDSPRSIGHSIGNQISSRIKDLNSQINELHWELGSLKAKIAARQQTADPSETDRLYETIKATKTQLAQNKIELDLTLNLLRSTQLALEKEKQDHQRDIENFSQKVTLLNKIIARQEIQLQNLLGNDPSEKSE
jgi:outer membrane murein-binding lipoprotein Lpp